MATKRTLTPTLRKALVSLAVLGSAGAVAGTGAFSAFSSTTSNDNNTITAGNVNISDNDAGSAAYSLSTAKPGDSASRCIIVTFTGNLPSSVKLYRSAFTGSTGLESHVDLVITKGTGSNSNCSDFSPAASGSSVYNSTLGSFSATSWSNGIALTNASGSSTWSQNDAVTYKVQATLQSSAPSTDQGLTTGTHSFTWEAQNN
jgi:hypothetical protein